MLASARMYLHAAVNRLLVRTGRLVRYAPLGLEAAASLSAASLALRVVSRRRVTRLLGTPTPPSVEPVGAPGRRARHVAWAVTRVADWLPWQPTCLPQAIATRWMLRRRGIPSDGHLGIVSTNPFAAHAWVSVAGAVVQGGPVGNVREIARLH